MDILGDGDEEVRLQKKYPLWTKEHTFRPQPYQFARFVAKVAYGFAVANLGIDCFKPLANDIILGRSDDYFQFAGSEPREPPPSGWPDGGQHHFSIVVRFVRDNVGLVVVDVKFFANAGTPVYHAVVGEIDLGKLAHFVAWERHRSNESVETDGRGAIWPGQDPGPTLVVLSRCRVALACGAVGRHGE